MGVMFSIITVCLNAGNAILETLNSVLAQEYSDYEIIVKDGISKDNTLALIPESEKIRVYSEKDSGIYNAMNQAVKYADGKYLCFLNAGDVFASAQVLGEVAKCIERQRADLYYGDYVRNGVIVRQPAALTAFALFRNPLNHQSMFFSRALFSGDVGCYDESYRILADYELTVRTFFSNKEMVYIPVTVDIYEGNGVSESKTGRTRANAEMRRIRKLYYGVKYYVYSLLIACTLVKLRQWMVKDSTPKWIVQTYRGIANAINVRGRK